MYSLQDLLAAQTSLEDLRYWYGQAMDIDESDAYTREIACSCVVNMDQGPLLVLDAVRYETLLYQAQLDIDEFLNEELGTVVRNTTIPTRPTSCVQNWIMWVRVEKARLVRVFLLSVPEAQLSKI
jgi:hypothetical protein